MKLRTLYVCNKCQTGYCHPLKYCYNCPGKIEPLEKKELSFPKEKGYFEGPDSYEQFLDWVESKGLKFGGR